MKYDRTQYKHPEMLWTDITSEMELRGRFIEYLDEELSQSITFKDWLETEEYFEQTFAEKI